MSKNFLKGSTLVVIIWAIVVLVVALGAFIFKPWQTKPTEKISVTAEGKSEVVPNIAKLSATVSTKNDDLNIAREQNEEKVDALISDLKDLGVEEKDIKTTNISGGPTYEIQIFPPPNRQKTNQISTTFEVTIRDFDVADEIIAAFTQNDAANLNGPRLTVDDQILEEAKSKARGFAVENAKKKADELATLSDRKLGKVTSIVEQGGFRIPSPIIAQSETDLQEKASQIQPGQTEISVTVQVDFELK